jgi:hypothetical protein
MKGTATMTPRVGVGFSELEDSFAAGQAMTRAAMAEGGLDACNLALLFSTCQHHPDALRDGVRSVIGPDAALTGGWAVGAITNDVFGYGGFQTGIACFSISSGDFHLFRADGLADREAEVGLALGEQLVAAEADGAQTPKLLFYDSINRLSGRAKLNMAMPLLAGIRQAIPHLNNLVGAGLVGDMAGLPTFQWFDDDISQQSAIALTFSPGITMHTAILRGAFPVGDYHTVTKAEGPAIIEIDGHPALDVISTLIEGAMDPSEFAFHLMLGVNQGDPWGPYEEENYSNCMCLRTDIKRKQVIMFEPELVEGTQFQLMSRNHDPVAIKRKVDELFTRVGEEQPFFALYINCAGRAGAYAGVEDEDARYVQSAIHGRAPLLGFYSGVEIGPIRGEPKSMDWTGVLCLFTIKI